MASSVGSPMPATPVAGAHVGQDQLADAGGRRPETLGRDRPAGELALARPGVNEQPL